MKIRIFLFSLLGLMNGLMNGQTFSASNFTMVSHIDPEASPNPSGDKYSACWGWFQASTSREYAIACSQTGTYWVDVTNPSTPTISCYRAGAHPGATWREVKTYQNFCYVASDDGGVNRFQIFDMQYLPDSVHKVYDSQALFKRGHTLYVEGNKLYVASVTYSNNNFSSMNVYSLATPTAPALIRSLDQDFPFISHVHDMYVRSDTVYASCGFDGLYVLRLTAANTFTMISSLTTYPFAGYNHSSALTPNGHTLVFMDEVPNSLPIKVADVTNLANIQVLATINQFTNTTPHNPFVVNNQYCFASSYQDGTQLIDISNPSAPFIAGYFDTYPQGGGNNNSWISGNEYEGQWGCYPFFPSKNIFALDQKNGIFMLSTHLYSNGGIWPSVGFSTPLAGCAGSSVTFTNTTSGASSYTWNFAGGNPSTSTLSSPTVSYTTAGIYNVTLTASNGTTQSYATNTLAIRQVLAATLFTHATCSSCNNGTAKVQASGGTAPYTYTWMPVGGNSTLAINLPVDCYTVYVTDAVGCTANKTLCISYNTGLASNKSNLFLPEVYPNPTSKYLNLDFEQVGLEYALYSSTGKCVFRGKTESEHQEIDVSRLSRGLYVLELGLEGKTLHKKVVLE